MNASDDLYEDTSKNISIVYMYDGSISRKMVTGLKARLDPSA
jgi:hypothetical protein